MTAIYFAFGGSTGPVAALEKCDWKERCPKILTSFFYIREWRKHEHKFHPTHTMLDSGAYSAWNSGKEIDIEDLIQETKNPYWKESVALDVIGDAEASLKNALYMKSQGSPAYPVFHIGDPWEILQEYKKQFDKIGLSCRFGETPKMSDLWYDQCFARAWPHKFHSFGYISEAALMRVPFHSGDSSSWALGPGAYGMWRDMNHLSIRPKKGEYLDLMSQIDSCLRMERRLQSRWRKELSRFDVPSKIENQGALL